MLTKQDFQSIYNIFITIMVWLGINITLQVRVHARVRPTTVSCVAGRH